MYFCDEHRGITRYYEILMSSVCEKYQLRQMEYDILMFLYNNPQHNTAADIVRYRKSTKSHVSMSLKVLEEKGLIETCGSVLYGNRYARQFRPTLTKEEYVAKLASLMHLKKSSISKVTVALLEELDGDGDEVISELETMIKEFKNQKKE